MPTRSNLLYYATGTTLAVIALSAVQFLFKTATPSSDTVARSQETVFTISTARFETGYSGLTKLDRATILIWRRTPEQMAQAKAQDDPALWRFPTSKVSGNRDPIPAHDADLTVDHEWFFAWPTNPTGFGCVVHPQMGDYGGFFDPCRADHFDLAGRLRKGIGTSNLHVISAKPMGNGALLQLDLSNRPKPKR